MRGGNPESGTRPQGHTETPQRTKGRAWQTFTRAPRAPGPPRTRRGFRTRTASGRRRTTGTAGRAPTALSVAPGQSARTARPAPPSRSRIRRTGRRTGRRECPRGASRPSAVRAACPPAAVWSTSAATGSSSSGTGTQPRQPARRVTGSSKRTSGRSTPATRPFAELAVSTVPRRARHSATRASVPDGTPRRSASSSRSCGMPARPSASFRSMTFARSTAARITTSAA